jgi:thioesterase domain-containing protein
MVKLLDKSSDGARESVTSDELSSLIIPLRAGGAQPPLFCMHDVFEKMADVLQTERAIYAVDYRCSDKMKLRLTVEDIAAAHLKEILKVQPHGPYYLIGFSLGAVVAYEMATMLASRGERVGLLALIDVYNPALYRESTSEAVQFRKRYRADRLRKYLGNLMRGDFFQLAADGSRLLKGKAMAIASAFAAKQYPRTREMLVNAYSPKEYHGQVILLRVEKPVDGGAEFEHDPSLGWNSCVKGGVDVKFVAGTHATVMDTPHVIDLASKLVPYL